MSAKQQKNTTQYIIPVVVLVMVVHGVYITHIVKVSNHTRRTPDRQPQSTAQLNAQPQLTPPQSVQPQSRHESSKEATSIPDVFIYRRTKKTGSSSMLEALLEVTRERGYVPLYHRPEIMPHVVRAECLKADPARLFIAQHNNVTRYHTPGRRAVIADTVFDGYRQITSYCRFVRHVEDCGENMVKCMESDLVLAQRYFRWAGHPQEDANTYIDLPLSSAHPALSTTILRHVFPDATLNIQRRNVVGSACEETKELREVYHRHYEVLDEQVDMLRTRILSITGYPMRAHKEAKATMADMLDAAEKIEARKYTFPEQHASKKVGDAHKQLLHTNPRWQRSESDAMFFKVKNGTTFSTDPTEK